MSYRYQPLSEYTVRPFDASGPPRVLIEAADGRQWQVAPATAQLLEALGETPSCDDAAPRLAERWKRPVSAAALERVIEDSLVPTGLVTREGEAQAASARRFGSRLAYLTVRLSLAPERVVALAARPFLSLYRPRVFWAACLTLLAAFPWLLVISGIRRGGDFWDGFVFSPTLFLLFFASQIVHEIGHAAACRALGARHGALGFGVYIVYPVFFMEMNGLWRLSRTERAIADLGGIFLQAAFAMALLVAGIVYAPLRALGFSLAVFIAVAAVFNLNPAFRTDGYWTLSDLLGVPNLRQRAMDAGRSALLRLFGRRTAIANAGGLSPGLAAALTVYSVASFAYISIAMSVFARRYFDVVGEYPQLVSRQFAVIADALRHGEPTLALAIVVRLLGPTALVLGGTVTAVMLGLQLWRSIASPRRVPAALTSAAGA